MDRIFRKGERVGFTADALDRLRRLRPGTGPQATVSREWRGMTGTQVILALDGDVDRHGRPRWRWVPKADVVLVAENTSRPRT